VVIAYHFDQAVARGLKPRAVHVPEAGQREQGRERRIPGYQPRRPCAI
jgi:hypothetical protein